MKVYAPCYTITETTKDHTYYTLHQPCWCTLRNAATMTKDDMRYLRSHALHCAVTNIHYQQRSNYKTNKTIQADMHRQSHQIFQTNQLAETSFSLQLIQAVANERKMVTNWKRHNLLIEKSRHNQGKWHPTTMNMCAKWQPESEHRFYKVVEFRIIHYYKSNAAFHIHLVTSANKWCS